jgi:predicted transposase YbfD/YdcC
LTTSHQNLCIASFEERTKTRGRTERRSIHLYKNINAISPDWLGLKRLILVERTVHTKEKRTYQKAYYISDIRSNKATFFAKHIRHHWCIENKLHWVKDVIMNEDHSKTVMGMAAENISIMRNIAINLFRAHGYSSIKYAMEFCANNFKKLIKLTNYKSINYKIT